MVFFIACFNSAFKWFSWICKKTIYTVILKESHLPWAEIGKWIKSMCMYLVWLRLGCRPFINVHWNIFFLIENILPSWIAVIMVYEENMSTFAKQAGRQLRETEKLDRALEQELIFTEEILQLWLEECGALRNTENCICFMGIMQLLS